MTTRALSESDILVDDQPYWAAFNPALKAYEIFRQQATHSVRCATIGKSLGLERVRQEIARRKAADAASAR
ncbi:MAG TPA: hypothetical protein P5256_17015 [Beijerinckiaceae bacterium]|nr:hypothetical protein [Rhodoblastus sp.]HRY04837.1 hypothetical protein [Beijerinckiaceae bacterium]